LFGFAGAHGAHKLGIGNFSASWDLMGKNEKHCVVAADSFTNGAV
jgi:hypothetical protein